MDIVFLLHRSTFSLSSSNDFSGQSVHHGFLTSPPGISNHPFDSKGYFSLWSYLHGNLECCTTYPTTLHLDGWSNIVQRFFPNLKTILTYFFFNFFHSIVEYLVGNTLLPIFHQAIYKLGDERITKLRVRKNISFFRFRFSHLIYQLLRLVYFFAALGRLAPYLDLPCLRSFTPAVSKAPRII